MDFLISNYLERKWDTPLTWSLSADDVRTAAKDSIAVLHEESGSIDVSAAQGEVTAAGSISIPVANFAAGLPEDSAFCLELSLSSGSYRNSYRFWVYPDTQENGCWCSDVVLAVSADAALDSLLSGGRRVLLVPGHDDIRKNSVGWLFTPDFWNWSMFKRVSERAGKEVSPGTLSLINDPGHPLFTLFPNDGHSDWQWWSICLNSRPLIMDSLDGYVPVLQVVDNVERCHKLGIISEFAAGNGSLLVCTVDLDAVSRYPEGRAFISSLLHYAASDEFKPSYRLEWDELLGLLYGRTASRDVQGVENTTDYSEYVSE